MPNRNSDPESERAQLQESVSQPLENIHHSAHNRHESQPTTSFGKNLAHSLEFDLSRIPGLRLDLDFFMDFELPFGSGSLIANWPVFAAESPDFSHSPCRTQ